MRRAAPIMLIALAAWTAPALAESPACDLMSITSAAQLDDVLKARAVEAIDIAAQPPTPAREARLAALVAPDAVFSLAWLDVIDQYETRGPEAARSLADAMSATSFMTDAWGGPDAAVANGCVKTMVVVHFMHSASRSRSRIQFTFQDGRIVTGFGAGGSYETGRIGG